MNYLLLFFSASLIYTLFYGHGLKITWTQIVSNATNPVNGMDQLLPVVQSRNPYLF